MKKKSAKSLIQLFIYKKKRYKIELKEFDQSKKLLLIKELKGMFNLGLKEAKEMTDKLPCIIGNDIEYKKMEELKTKLESLGCSLNIS